MDKVVKTNKKHRCEYCGNIIPKGSKAFYMEGRTPKYERKGFEEKQIGIEYYKVYYCYAGIDDNMPACYNESNDYCNCDFNTSSFQLDTGEICCCQCEKPIKINYERSDT